MLNDWVNRESVFSCFTLALVLAAPRRFLEELRTHMEMTSSERGVVKLKESQVVI